jgi:uncharacterized protein YndB with AHSA1/START domain
MKNETQSGSTASTFVYTRVLNAPRKLVYETYTQAEHVAHWWGPKNMPITVHRFEPHPGGTFLYSMAIPNGEPMFGKVVYREMNPHELLSFVVSFTDAEGNPVRHPMSATWPLEVLSTLTLTEENGKTTLHMLNQPINASEEDHATFAGGLGGMTIGTDGMMENYEAYLEKIQA